MTLILFYVLAFRIKWREIFALFLVPLARKIPAFISPNHITILSFIFILVSGLSLYLAKDNYFFFLWAALFLLIFILIDSLDGFLARIRHQITLGGSFLDYTLDKISYLFLLFTLILGGHIKSEIVVITMLCSLFYNLVDMESRALDKSTSPLAEHSRWLAPAIILCLVGFSIRYFGFETLNFVGVDLKILDILFLTLPIYVFVITIYRIIIIWKKLGRLDQGEGLS